MHRSQTQKLQGSLKDAQRKSEHFQAVHQTEVAKKIHLAKTTFSIQKI
jgi:hypothetical protein